MVAIGITPLPGPPGSVPQGKKLSLSGFQWPYHVERVVMRIEGRMVGKAFVRSSPFVEGPTVLIFVFRKVDPVHRR